MKTNIFDVHYNLNCDRSLIFVTSTRGRHDFCITRQKFLVTGYRLQTRQKFWVPMGTENRQEIFFRVLGIGQIFNDTDPWRVPYFVQNKLARPVGLFSKCFYFIIFAMRPFAYLILTLYGEELNALEPSLPFSNDGWVKYKWKSNSTKKNKITVFSELATSVFWRANLVGNTYFIRLKALLRSFHHWAFQFKANFYLDIIF